MDRGFEADDWMGFRGRCGRGCLEAADHDCARAGFMWTTGWGFEADAGETGWGFEADAGETGWGLEADAGETGWGFEPDAGEAVSRPLITIDGL